MAQKPHRVHADPYRDGWERAIQLADWLRAGGAMPHQQSAFVLVAGEVLHCTVPAEVGIYTGLDVDYQSSFFAFGQSWKGLAATAGASMLYNSLKRRSLEREAQTQWRSCGNGAVSVTSDRLMFPIDGQITTHWFNGGITAFQPYWEHYLAIAQIPGSQPIAFRGPSVPYLSVLLGTLLFHEVPSMATPNPNQIR